MHLVPRELENLIVFQAGFVAQRRLARGIKLNHAEATALISTVLLELIRDGKHSVDQLMSLGTQILRRRQVDPSVLATLLELQVEGNFPTGVHLVTVNLPISTEKGDLKQALYGSFLPIPDDDAFGPYDEAEYADEKLPGAVTVATSGEIELSKGRKRLRLRITNTGDRPVQVGSHYHLIEANPMLDFDRIKAYGYHLDIPAGTSVRFEPGDAKTVTIVAIGGLKTIYGGSGIASGVVDTSRADDIISRLSEGGFLHTPEAPSDGEESPSPFKMTRQEFATMFGPTTGDTLRLSGMDLWIKIEDDLTIHGDECTFGGGKTIRDGMAQASGRSDAETPDVVITNALIIDWTGIFKADIGIKDGMIVAVGKAGNPDIMDGVHPQLVVGLNTDIIAGEGKIVTAGGIDTHCHAICPQQSEEAMASGITTQFTGGTGPSTGTLATNCTPNKYFVERMMKACDILPVNFGIIGKGNDAGTEGLHDLCKAGVAGLKIHEDWGSTPAVIDNTLGVCDEFDVQCELHSDSLNESGFVDRTAAAFKDRTIHAYHIEGAGGGHAPDVMTLVEKSHVLPSSTNPTLPYTTDTVEEHLDMLISCHHLSKAIPEDLAFAESRIRAETIGAEDVLHDMGAISMVSSDSQAMGRPGEVILRTWNTAHVNKVFRGHLPEDEGTNADNFRVKRYISKYTINPAITQGISHVVGDVSPGKLADLVLWDPERFGAKPAMVLKSGWVAYAQLGTPNGSIAGIQPVMARPMFAALSPVSSVMFVSQAGLDTGAVKSYGLSKRIETVKNCRKVKKEDLKFNGITPKMKVDPELFKVTVDGQPCVGKAATWVPLGQQHYLF